MSTAAEVGLILLGLLALNGAVVVAFVGLVYLEQWIMRRNREQEDE